MFAFYFIIGCFCGSFFDCQIERLTKNIPLLTKRSFCLKCQHPLNFWDLIPLASQLFLKNKCRYCDKAIPMYHVISEVLCGFIAILYYSQIITFHQSIIICTLYFISFCDSHSKSFPLILWLIPFIFLISNVSISTSTLLALLIALISQKFYIGIGSGDFLVIALLSLDLQSNQLLWVIQIASFLGIIYFSLKKKNESIAFVPFLTASYLIILIRNVLN